MSAVRDAAEMLETALKGLDGIGVYRDPAATIDPPAVFLGPPALTWEAGCAGPTSATFLIYAVVAQDELSAERLWDLVVQVADVIDTTDAVVVRADPGTFGIPPLPCYEIATEVSLR